jgi:hypothetical protein
VRTPSDQDPRQSTPARPFSGEDACQSKIEAISPRAERVCDAVIRCLVCGHARGPPAGRDGTRTPRRRGQGAARGNAIQETLELEGTADPLGLLVRACGRLYAAPGPTMGRDLHMHMAARASSACVRSRVTVSSAPGVQFSPCRLLSVRLPAVRTSWHASRTRAYTHRSCEQQRLAGSRRPRPSCGGSHQHLPPSTASTPTTLLLHCSMILEKFVVEIRAIMAGPAHGGGAVCQLGRGR